MHEYKVGDRVQWTHISQRGRTIDFSVRVGVVTEVLLAGDVAVKYRGKLLRKRADRLRPYGAPSELNDLVAAMAGGVRGAAV